MLNCIYQDSSRKSFTRILSFWNFRKISRNENLHQAFGSSFGLSANSSGISFYVKVHAVIDVKQISLTWILLIYSNFEILAWCMIFAKKYWNVFAFFERRVQMVGDLFRSVLHFFLQQFVVFWFPLSLYLARKRFMTSKTKSTTQNIIALSRRLVAIFHIYKSLNILKILNLPLDVASV